MWYGGEFLSGVIHKTYDPEQRMKGACNLSSLFLQNFVSKPFTKDAIFSYSKLRKSIHAVVRFLDNIIDINNYPHEDFKLYQQALRTIGVGTTGLANAMAMLGMKYGDKQSVDFVDELYNFIAKESYKASIELAKEKGSFPFYNDKFLESGFIKKHIEIDEEWNQIADDIKQYGIRNARCLSIAPNGTLSLAYGNNCSSGLEPTFSLEMERRVKVGGQEEKHMQTVMLRDHAYYMCLKTKDKDVDKSVFVTTQNLTIENHLDILEKITFHVDMSCSKTINVPTDYSFEDTQKIFLRVFDNSVKGCTIFRPNAVRQGIFVTKQEDVKAKFDVSNIPWGTTMDSSDDLIGKKRKLTTGCGSLHVQAWFDPISAKLMEIYLSKGSEGGCNSFMIALSRAISAGLRTGMDFNYAVDQLKSATACPSYVGRNMTKKDTSRGKSCPDAIGNCLIEMQAEILDEISIGEDEYYVTEDNDEVEIASNDDELTAICPECGEKSLNISLACATCTECGFSKCG